MSVQRQQEETISASNRQVKTASPSDLVRLRVFLLDPEVLAANEEIIRSSGCFDEKSAAIADSIAKGRLLAVRSSKSTEVVVKEP